MALATLQDSGDFRNGVDCHFFILRFSRRRSARFMTGTGLGTGSGAFCSASAGLAREDATIVPTSKESGIGVFRDEN